MIPLINMKDTVTNMSAAVNDTELTLEELTRPEFWKAILDNTVEWLVSELPSIVFTVILFMVLFRLVNFLVKKVKKIAEKRIKDNQDELEVDEALKRLNTLSAIVQSVTRIILWIIFILIFLSKFGIDIAPILASAGILGLAIGFGSQELVRDFITGFFILLEDQVRTGDVAIINGTTGKVEKIEMRTITLRDPSGVVHIFQNGKINSLSNMTKGWSAILVEIGIAYKEDVDKVAGILKEVCENMLKDEQTKDSLIAYDYMGLDSFGDSSVNLLVKLTTKSGEQWAMSREYRRRVKYIFDEKKVEIPFPHISIYAGEVSAPIQVEVKNNGK